MTAWIRNSVMAAILAGGAGCVNFNHTAYHSALRTPNAAPVAPPARSQVHVFLMNGLDVVETGRIHQLRDQLVCAGFAKVYITQRADQEWYAREMRRLAVDEPDARLVLVGYGAAAAPVYNLAYAASRDGLPVDGIVLLDPVGLNGDLTTGLKTHSVMIRSHHWRGSIGLTAREEIEVRGVGHNSLPTSAVAVDAIIRVLTASAANVHVEPPDALPFLALTDHPDPSPRPFAPLPKATPKADGE